MNSIADMTECVSKRAPAVLITLLACVCAVAQAQGTDLSKQREAWNRPMAPFRIIGDIYYVGTAGLASYLVTTPQGHFLIDAGLEESAAQIEQNIQTLGFKLGDIKYLLNSHAHLDHSGGLARLKKDSGAVLIASEGDRTALEKGFYLGSEQNHQLDAPPVRVDRMIADGQALTIDGTTLTANLTPGHTRGCTSWSMTATEAGKPYRVLFFCSSTVAANRLVGPPQYPGIVTDYEKTFAKAKQFKVDVFLAPHPEFFRLREKRDRQTHGDANPFVDPTEFPAFIARSEADFRKQLAEQQAALQ